MLARDFSIGRTLGKGAYAVVKEAQYKFSEGLIAIKSYEKRKMVSKTRQKSVKREIQLLKNLSHPNIIKVFD